MVSLAVYFIISLSVVYTLPALLANEGEIVFIFTVYHISYSPFLTHEDKSTLPLVYPTGSEAPLLVGKVIGVEWKGKDF